MPDEKRNQKSGPGTDDTTEYSASRAPETKAQAEERDSEDVKDPRLFPGGAHGSPADPGMSSLHREVVVSGGDDLGLPDYGDVDETSRTE